MSNHEKLGFIFSNENAVLRGAAAANTISWLALLVFIATLVTNFWSLFDGTVPFSELFNQPASLVNALYVLTMGAVYFGVLQGFGA